MFIISFINCSFKRVWALLQHDYWYQVDYIPNKLNMFLISKPWEHKRVSGMKQPQMSAFQSRFFLWINVNRVTFTSWMDPLMYAKIYRGNRKEPQQCVSLTLQTKSPIHHETSYYVLNPGVHLFRDLQVTNGFASGVKWTPTLQNKMSVREGMCEIERESERV